MGHRHHGAGVFLQVTLQPSHGLGVQVVGRFVEQQHVRLLQQQLAKRHAAALATRQLGDIGIARRTAQGVHGDVHLAIQVPGVGGVDPLLQLGLLGDQLVHLLGIGLGEGVADRLETVEQGLGLRHALEDVTGDVLVLVELRLLRQVADPDTLGGPRLTVDFRVDAGHDPHQRRLTGTVEAEDADLGAGQKEQPDVLQDLLAARVGLGHAVHLVDVLIGSHEFSGTWKGCR